MPWMLPVALGASSAIGAGTNAATSGKAATPKIPKAFREPVLQFVQMLQQSGQNRQPYQYQRTAQLDPMQIAAAGNAANQAFNIGAPQPTTSATQSADYWSQARGLSPTPQMPTQGAGTAQGMQAPMGAPGPSANSPIMAPQGATGGKSAGGANVFNPYANLAYAMPAMSGVPNNILSMFMAPGIGPNTGPAEWSPYNANTPGGQIEQGAASGKKGGK